MVNVHPSFVPLDSASALPGLRRGYLDTLYAGQDALLETLVQDGVAYTIELSGATAGYVVVHGGDTIVELSFHDPYVAFAQDVVPRFVDEFAIGRALVKSFDHLAMACCLDLQTRVEVRGMLIRDYIPRPLPVIDRIRYTQRLGHPSDLQRVLDVDQPVFTRADRLEALLRRGQLWLFEHERAVIGFGILRPVIPGRPDVEVGIAVDARYRNRGHAIFMLRDLIERCAADGHRPITGCAHDNIPSIRMGQRVGFTARHRLLEVHFSPRSSS